MEKIKLAIIFGGNSSEYPVSLHSTASVLRNLNQERYEIVLIGITQKGEWYLYSGDIDSLEQDEWKQLAHIKKVVLSTNPKEGFLVLEENGFVSLPVDCIFPILHGKNGEDGTLQGLLELTKIPYVGCNTTSSAIAMDKEYTHILCEAKGIKMAKYVMAYKESYDASKTLADAQGLKLPLFIKPANAGSSFGISKITSYSKLDQAIQFAFAHDRKVLIEEGIDGFEVGCSVLGNTNLTIGECDEIDTHNAFFDYEAKYALENTLILCPARLDATITNKIKSNAEKIYRLLGCRGLSRIDMFISSKQEIYFNEINTIPGFTAASRYPTMMSKVGINFTSLIDQLVDLALEVGR